MGIVRDGKRRGSWSTHRANQCDNTASSGSPVLSTPVWSLLTLKRTNQRYNQAEGLSSTLTSNPRAVATLCRVVRVAPTPPDSRRSMAA